MIYLTVLWLPGLVRACEVVQRACQDRVREPIETWRMPRACAAAKAISRARSRARSRSRVAPRTGGMDDAADAGEVEVKAVIYTALDI
jgi:hypothetical protein